jgi:hypothetical protein
LDRIFQHSESDSIVGEASAFRKVDRFKTSSQIDERELLVLVHFLFAFFDSWTQTILFPRMLDQQDHLQKL